MLIVDDNFCSKEDQDAIYKYFLGESAQFQWYFGVGTNIAGRKEVIETSKVVEQFQMANRVESTLPIYPTIFKIFKEFLDKHNINFEGIIRVKANLLTRGNKEGYHLPHVDSNIDHKVFLYYINDSDGDTYMFDKMFDQNIDVDPNTFNVVQRVSPKAGRAIVFDGRQYHASSSPMESDYRCVINIDFFDQKNER